MAGLSKSKNLSERGLNLKNALQKLYAPGIEKDLELFSLSSKITSTVISGPKTPAPEDSFSQIYGFESQKLRVKLGDNFTVFDRTKFLTKFYTFTNGNLVYFTKFGLSELSPTSNAPKFSNNGSVANAKLAYGGRGFYLNNPNGSTFRPANGPDEFELKNIILVGKDSLAETARATLVFTKEPSPSSESESLYYTFTPGSTDRYYISEVTITTGGRDYLPKELLLIKENQQCNFYEEGIAIPVVLKKQYSEPFILTGPILKNSKYYYEVVNADSNGFFLYDLKKDEYVFLDRNSSELTNTDIEIRREDFIRAENLLQFKFAGSPIYLKSYTSKYQLTDSIATEIGFLNDRIERLYASAQTAIQNTKLPTPIDSESNELGYAYNSFVGRDVVIWQRVVMRDQDYLINPGSPGSRTGLTGEKLKTDVENFKLSLTPQVISITNYIGKDSSTVEATIDSTESLQEGDTIVISGASGAQQSKLNGSWKILSVLSDTKFEFLCSEPLDAGTYTANLGTATVTPSLRVPGIFIKVGQDYFRAFSTIDKPFLEEENNVISNPNLSVSRGKTDVGALSAENQLDGEWYSYNTQIAQFAQRISYDATEPDNKLKSKNGAFCFYKSTAPRVIGLSVRRGDNPLGTIYSVPLFSL